MIKKFYIFAWLLLIVSIGISAVNGAMSGIQIVTLGLIGLALVYAFALWVVIANTREPQME
jgi:hypothetical protein